MAQVLALVAGILVVRSLDKPSYAQYAIITSLIAAMTLLSESGVSSGLMTLGASKVGNFHDLSELFASALAFRRTVASLVLSTGGGVLIVLLLINGATILESLVYTGIVSVTFWPILTKGTLQPYFRVARRFQFLQQVSLYSSTLRVGLVLVLASISELNIPSLVTVGLICAWFEVYLFASGTRGELSLRGHRANLSHTPLFRKNLRQTMPMNLMLVAQTQLLYVFLGAFGSTAVVAEIAAVSRITLVFTLLNGVIGDMGSGAVARAATRAATTRAMAKYLGSFTFASALIVLAVFIFSHELVSLLGSSYSNTAGALVVVTLGAALISFAEGFRVLNQARGWLRWSWLYIPGTTAWAGIGIFVFDVGTLNQAAWLVTLQAVPGLIAQSACLVHGMRQTRA